MVNQLSTILGSKRVTMSQVSKATGISRSTLIGLYHERTDNPDTKTVLAICKYLEITPNDFFGIDEKEVN